MSTCNYSALVRSEIWQSFLFFFSLRALCLKFLWPGKCRRSISRTLAAVCITSLPTMSTPSSDSSKVRSYSNFGRAAQRIAAAAAVSGAIWYVATTRKKRRQLSAKNDADYFPINVGNLHTPVDTVVAAAQTWFDRGIAWTSNYHREEADYCFRMATKADPKCAMAFWGIALVNGPDYNFHLDTGFYDVAKQPSGYPSLNVANTAARTAEKMSRVTNWQGKPAHRALIEAMVTRYEWPVTDSTPDLQKDYLKSMRAVAERHPDDPLVAVCHAEAALTMTPWKLYDPVPGFTLDQGAPGDGRTPNKFGLEGAKAIDHGLRLSPNNHWLAHLKIHYNEMGYACKCCCCSCVRGRSILILAIVFEGH